MRTRHNSSATFALGLALCVFVMVAGIGLVWFLTYVVNTLAAKGY